jgi:hypothetical protein
MDEQTKKYKQEVFENEINLVNDDKIIPSADNNGTNDLSNAGADNLPSTEIPAKKTTQPIKDDSTEQPKKRGRKKGSTKEVLQAKKQEVVSGAKHNAKQDIDLSQYGQVETPTDPNATDQDQAQANQVDISKYISGALLLMMIDFLLPTLFTFVYPKLKRLKDKKKLKMTKDERKELEPIADECIKQVAMKLSPMEAMALMLLFVYGGKIYELDDSDFKPETPTK